MGRRALALVAALTLMAQAKAAPVERPADALAGLAEHQLEYCKDPSRRRVITGGRRSGKTEAVIADLIATAIEGGDCVYISLTRRLAKRTVWKRLKARARKLGLSFTTNESELRLDLAGGGCVELGGADDKDSIERYRGPDYALVVIDECGSQNPLLLRDLVTDVLRPALMDHRGRLVLAGTPGPTLEGYWYAVSSEVARAQPSVYCWTLHDNPIFEGRAEEELDAVIEENAAEGWTRTHVSFRREYLGRWIKDKSVLVYPYEKDTNAVEGLPKLTPKGWGLDDGQWRRVIAVDVGTTENAMAFAVWTGHRGLPYNYLVHAEAHTGMLIPQLAERLRQLKEEYPRARIIMDAGGMGAAHAKELRAIYGLSIIAAVKTEKASAITVMREMLMAGRVKVLTLPSLDGVRAEWSVLGWDDKHLQHNPNQADHYSDACLYGLRHLKSWRLDQEHGRKPPARMSEEAMLAAEEKMWARDDEAQRRSASRSRRRR